MGETPNNEPESSDESSACEYLYFESLIDACKEATSDREGVMDDSLLGLDGAPEDVDDANSSRWDHPDYNAVFEAGSFDELQLAERIETLPNGEVILRDVGLNFYRVRSGDTLSGIKGKLEKYPEFAYLREYDHSSSVSCFNIRPKDLRAGELIPIPLPRHERVFTEDEFTEGCYAALESLRNHPEYAAGVKTILEKVSVKDLVASMMAIAVTEAGGEPVGQFSLHRFEPHESAFSYTIFHVLDSGPGRTAREKLNMTVGQSLHPRNSAMLFLAYLCEKTKGDPGKYFPIDGGFEAFSSFYNGNWESRNPKYPERLEEAYDKAQDILADANFDELDFSHAKVPPHVLDSRRGIKTSSEAPLWSDPSKLMFRSYRDDWPSYYKFVRYANADNSTAAGLTTVTFMLQDSTIEKFAESLVKQTGKSKPSPGESIAVGKDENGVFVAVKSKIEIKKYYYLP